jgi:hypothetical protein
LRADGKNELANLSKGRQMCLPRLMLWVTRCSCANSEKQWWAEEPKLKNNPKEICNHVSSLILIDVLTESAFVMEGRSAPYQQGSVFEDVIGLIHSLEALGAGVA